MMPSQYVIEVSEDDFEIEVLAYSNQIPVVVDFWAEWCAPCRILGPILEKLAEEGQGAFRLAKVNVDENPNLAMQYDVRGIPAVKAIYGEGVIAEFTGAQPEPRVREFLRQLAPSPADLYLEKGHSLLAGGEWGQAAESFRQALDKDPDHASALLGLAKSLIAQGDHLDALPILREFPASKEYNQAEQLLPLAKALAEHNQSKQDEDDPLEATYLHALDLVRRGNIPAALDGLLDVLREDKKYGDGKARQVFLGALTLLGDDGPQAREYRDELAAILF